uniref:F-box domain-containing protein n=1 Tax=Oryza nivara TaxID=4536 RepID=A0A0E0HCK3_ORYNI
MNRLRRRRGTSVAPPVTLPDDDDLLSEILLRLPPRPSSLPRASLVCKRWRRLVTDPAFHRRFRARHRNPPLIGVFEDYLGYPFFRSVLDPPDLIPRERFRLRLAEDEGGQWRFYGCRHGRVLLFNRAKNEILVWVPDTGDHHRVAVPPEIDGKEKIIWNGAVLSAATADDGFSSCPFKVVLVGVAGNNTQMFACVYCSESGKWSDLISVAAPFLVFFFRDPGILVGHALYWMASGDHGSTILQFDLDDQTPAVIEWPSDSDPNCYTQTWLTEGDCLRVATFSRGSLQMWERKVCSEGVAKWVLQKTYELKNVLNPEIRLNVEYVTKLGYVQDIKVMFVWAAHSVFMLQLDSLQAKKVWESCVIAPIHPYASTYVADYVSLRMHYSSPFIYTRNYGLRKTGKVSRL